VPTRAFQVLVGVGQPCHVVEPAGIFQFTGIELNPEENVTIEGAIRLA